MTLEGRGETPAERVNLKQVYADSEPTMSVVVPVRNGGATLGRCLSALTRFLGTELEEIVVVDDGSTDGSAQLAEDLGATVVSTRSRPGIGAIRNLGAERIRSEIVIFVDGDVVVEDAALSTIRKAFRDPQTMAVFGRYGDTPRHLGFFSHYMNLRHAYYHRYTQCTTFWAGCGAIRLSAFSEIGGFPNAFMEDIEIGYRLRKHGHPIRFLPDLRGVHLKEWTLRSVVLTDIILRAIPWGRLLLVDPQAVPDLNVSHYERLCAAVSLAIVSSSGLALGGIIPGWVPLLAVLLATAMNWSLLTLFRRKRGLLFAVGALAFHQVYYLYGSAAYVGCTLEHYVLNPLLRLVGWKKGRVQELDDPADGRQSTARSGS